MTEWEGRDWTSVCAWGLRGGGSRALVVGDGDGDDGEDGDGICSVITD